jgi:hypothetical protein
MVYWKNWKSSIGGGIGFLILGIFMVFLFSMPGASGGRGIGGLDIMQIGLIFIVIGIIMINSWICVKKKIS